MLDLIDELEPYGNLAIELDSFALPIFGPEYLKIMSLIRGILIFFETAISSVQYRVQQQYSERNGLARSKLIEEMLVQGISPGQVPGELQNIFFAAFNTPTVLLVNLFDCVARHTKTAACLEADIVAVVGDHVVEEAEPAHLAYLRAKIFQILRLHTPVTYHTCKTWTCTTMPCGGGPDGHCPVFVRRGTSITSCTYALNQDAEVLYHSKKRRQPRTTTGEERGLSFDELVDITACHLSRQSQSSLVMINALPTLWWRRSGLLTVKAPMCSVRGSQHVTLMDILTQTNSFSVFSQWETTAATDMGWAVFCAGDERTSSSEDEGRFFDDLPCNVGQLCDQCMLRLPRHVEDSVTILHPGSIGSPHPNFWRQVKKAE